jgi:molybdenum cofactor cytidylyltransferase
VGAIVLAAGKSERMGRPKALLRAGDGTTFLEVLVASIRQASLGEPVVVLGHHRDVILETLRPARWVYNPDYELGMTTSFQVGIRALDAPVGAVLFLVDHPAPDPITVRALVARGAADRIVVPRFGGRRGHPVYFGAEPLGEVLALGPERGANEVVRRVPARVFDVDVPDPAVIVDLDTPREYDEWRSKSTEK